MFDWEAGEQGHRSCTWGPRTSCSLRPPQRWGRWWLSERTGEMKRCGPVPGTGLRISRSVLTCSPLGGTRA